VLILYWAILLDLINASTNVLETPSIGYVVHDDEPFRLLILRNRENPRVTVKTLSVVKLDCVLIAIYFSLVKA